MLLAVTIPAAVSLAGAAMGSKGSTTGSSSSFQLDPRIQAMLYGSGSGGNGLLADMTQNYQTQHDQGGLNSTQRAGMEMQRQTLMDPGYTAGYNQMRNVGMGLLGAPIAGNPFTTGAKNGSPFQGGNVQAPPAQSQQFQQNPQIQAAYQPMAMPTQSQPSQQTTPASTPLDDYIKSITSGNFQNGFGNG